MLAAMEEVRRTSDGELCGHIDEREAGWLALTVFGAALGRYDRRQDAIDHVLADGLAALAERWTLRHGATGEEEVVCIQEANATEVTLAVGYHSTPGMPTRTISVAQLTSGEWELHR
jgi:hypothetical protein